MQQYGIVDTRLLSIHLIYMINIIMDFLFSNEKMKELKC